MKSCEPIPGLRFYFEDWHKGAYQIIDKYENMNKQRIENSDYAEIIALEPKYEWKRDKKTNQQATANHTAKMFNQSKVDKPMMTLDDYYQRILNPLAEKYRKEAMEEPIYSMKDVEAMIVEAFEALGLIKFDEEKSLSVVDILNGYTCYTAAILESLDKHGYKIVKK